MFSKEKSSSPQYEPLALHEAGEGSSSTPEKRSSSEDDDSGPLLRGSDDLPPIKLSKPSQLPKLIIYLSFTLALLSTVNIALLPSTFSKFKAYPFSESELKDLPYGNARLGLDRAAKVLPIPKVYHRSWPDRIARVSRRLKDAVWGQGVQVYVTVEVRLCVLSFLF